MSPPVALGLVILVASAELGPARSAAAQIRDNSFLVEEAYNQDRNVVQHIGVFTSSRDGRWVFNATDEWPLGGLRDQVSTGLTLFYEGLGVEYGTLALNYRRQMIGHPDASVVFSPRVTLIAELGAGAGTGLAMQANLPLTVVLSGAFVSHWNLGATIGLGPALGNAGGSVVWLATPWMNFLVEGLYLGAAGAAPGYVVSPGVRWAANLGSVQVVPGVAFPISLTDAEDDLLLFYLSIEHPFASAGPN